MYRCQKGVSIAQNINFVLISFLVIFMTIEFISHLVSCFPAIGGVIFSHKGLGNGQWIVWYGTRNMYISMKYEGKTKILTKMRSKSCLLIFFLLNLIVLEFFQKSQILKHSK